MKNLLSILLIGICYYGCNKKNESESKLSNDVYYLKAKVQQTRDISCYKPVLDFTEDSVKIYSLTNSKSLRFNVINLPTHLNIVGNKLYVQVALLKPEEYYPCNTLGVPYPPLKVIEAKIRE